MQGLDIETALDWRGRTVVDRRGDKIGTLREIYLDESQRPSWGSVHTGLFGLRETLVPLSEARPDADRLLLPYERDHVKDAPNVDPDVQLTGDEERQLYRHYGLEGERSDAPEQPGAVAARGAPEAGGERTAPADPAPPGEPDRSESAAATSHEDDAMTRSEEEVHIGKRTRERGRARLRKYVVTDYVETKVPVKREEVRLEHDPPDERDAGA